MGLMLTQWRLGTRAARSAAAVLLRVPPPFNQMLPADAGSGAFTMCKLTQTADQVWAYGLNYSGWSSIIESFILYKLLHFATPAVDFH